MKNICYGIVGTGYFGAGLARLLAEQEGATVVAVFDPENGEAFAREMGGVAEPTLAALCERDDVDAVIVASPNYLHKEPVLQAARSKKHIFCEKPIALCYEDCDQMVRAAKESGVLFMAGHIMHFMNGVEKIKELIGEGRIGDVLYAHSCRNGWEAVQDSVSWKKIREKSGGHLYHHIHELDFIQWIMGPAIAGYMVGGNVAHKGEQFGDEDDILLITLEFENGTYATMQYGSAFHMGDHFVKIQGTKGALWMDLQEVKVVAKTETGEERYLLHESQEEDDDRTAIYRSTEVDSAIAYGKPGKIPPLWLHTLMRKEMEFFHATLQGQARGQELAPLLDGTAARAAIATADALTKSMLEKRRVTIGEIIHREK